MINAHVMIASGYGYDRDIHIELQFPALPRRGDFICIPDWGVEKLTKMILSEYSSFQDYIDFVLGRGENRVLYLDSAETVLTVDWYPSKEDPTVMQCVILIDNCTKKDIFLSDHPKYIEITEEEYLTIKRNTESLFANAKSLSL